MRRTELRRKSPMRRTGIKSRLVSTGPDTATVDAVLERDGHMCAVGGHPLGPVRGVDWSIHHRRPRGMGGTSAPDVNLPSNLLTVCGNGVEGCHGLIEAHRAAAYERGWLLRGGDVPSQVPILHALHNWCYLTDDGLALMAPPPINRDGDLDFGGYWADQEASDAY